LAKSFKNGHFIETIFAITKVTLTLYFATSGCRKLIKAEVIFAPASWKFALSVFIPQMISVALTVLATDRYHKLKNNVLERYF